MNRRASLFLLAAFALAGCASFGSHPSDVVATAQSTPNLSTLAKLVNDAGFADTLKAAGPYTVFAPTNEAFAALPKKTLDDLAADKSKLRAVLAYHVVAGKIDSKDVKPGKVKTVNGAELTFQRTGEFVTINEDAIAVTPDVQASNGIVHVIDRVLIPPVVK